MSFGQICVTMTTEKHNRLGLAGTSQVRNCSLEDEYFNKIVDDYTTDVVIIVQYCIVSTLINIFGISSNVINIIVFAKQGFGESINISLLGLAVSDLCSLLTLEWLNVCFSPLFSTFHLPIINLEFAYVTAGWPRMAFTRITAWITAFITFERCICITMPLKVKMIFTPRKTVITITTIFMIVLAAVAPSYYTSRLSWKFDMEKNRTVLGIVFTKDRQAVDSVVFAISNVCLPVLSFVIVVICTVILGVKLNSKSKWREQSASKAGQTTIKDKKIVKMVSFISTIFIFCFLPNAVIFAAMAVEPEFNLDGKYRNIFIVISTIFLFLESVNSSINIFIYLKMSSKFRDTFNQLLYGADDFKK